jgi:cell division protein FtsB
MLGVWKKYRKWLVIGFMIVWMTFIDRNNFINLYEYRSELSELRGKKAYYQEEIERMKTDRAIIFNDSKSLERYAREKYLMKKDNEDIYFIQ